MAFGWEFDFNTLPQTPKFLKLVLKQQITYQI